MVSKARDDLPLPLIPVMTTSWFFGMEISIFLRLCTRAPNTSIISSPIAGDGIFCSIIDKLGIAKDNNNVWGGLFIFAIVLLLAYQERLRVMALRSLDNLSRL